MRDTPHITDPLSSRKKKNNKMNTRKLESKLKYNGIKCINGEGKIELIPIKKSDMKYLVLAFLFIPSLLIFFFVTGPSIIGFLVLGAGISLLYNGIKTRNEIQKFNSSFLTISENELIINNDTISYLNFIEFKAKLASNTLFPNTTIVAKTSIEEIEVLKIWNTNKAHLNKDKYEIVSDLNEIVSEFKNK